MTAYVARAGRWSSPPLAAGDEAVAVWAAETLAGVGADSLCVATRDAGVRESVDFWRSGSETGLAFASPRAFPWTLANSPTGRIAQELGVRGPTFTLVGRADALTGAVEHALAELASGRASRVLVAALDAVSARETRLAAVSIASTDGSDRLAVVVPATAQPAAETLTRPSASETLAAVVDRVEAGSPAGIGSERDGWFEFRPHP